jgi:propane 2-monooxygenase small subunit
MTAETEKVSIPQQRSVPKPEFTDAEAGALEFPDSTERNFNYFKPAKRKQTHYEDVTVEVQPDPRHYLAQGWLYGFSDGRGGYPLDWTALKAWGSDRPEPERYPGSGGKGYDWPAHGWHEFRDPNEEWELTLSIAIYSLNHLCAPVAGFCLMGVSVASPTNPKLN